MVPLSPQHPQVFFLQTGPFLHSGTRRGKTAPLPSLAQMGRGHVTPSESGPMGKGHTFRDAQEQTEQEPLT